MHLRRLLPLVLGTLLAFAALAADPPAAPQPPASTYTGLLSLVRYDLTVPFSDGFAPTRRLVQRRDGQDAVDWPKITLSGKPVFQASPEEKLTLPVRKGGETDSPFQVKADERIEPGNHWFRAVEGAGQKRYLYTADSTARTGNATETMTGRYELWTFPVKITAEGAPIKVVVLKAGGQTVYQQDGPWRSLTLLLPASDPDRPYELSVDSRPAVKFHVGLLPVKAGTPSERVRPVDLTLSGESPRIRVQNLTRPEEFPASKEWQEDVESLGRFAPFPVRAERPAGLRKYLGSEVPRSPFTIYAAELPHGLSGGFFRQRPAGFAGSAEEYGVMLTEQGFDLIFDAIGNLPGPEDAASIEQRAAALAKTGVRLGVQYESLGIRPSLQHSQVALYSHTLPEWHAPIYRSLALAAQRLGRLPNFAGFNIGAGSDGYAISGSGERASPSRPWGEAMQNFMGTPQPTMPRLASAGPPQQPYEYVAKSAADFQKYVQRFDATFRQYGYFAEAVRQVAPRLVFTTAAFGSAPGTSARGGWPSASLPGRIIAEGLPVQQAYDLNRARAAKPLHNVALTDRLRSYWPKKPTWSLLDNHQFLYGREGYQRACALALTRGIQGLGTNFLAAPTGANARPEIAAYQAEMHGWIHRFGGVFAHGEPLASIGVFYGHQEALQRAVLKGEAPPEEQLYDGSHEGKVTEALFLCQAAQWPARVITYQEITRGELPASMQAILLVGMKQVDATSTSGRGLEAALQKFVARGGRVLADEESSWAAPFTTTKLRIAAYQPASGVDPTPLLFARNQENILVLQDAMQGLPDPLATSRDTAVWTIPTLCGDVQYVTALNQGCAQGAEAAEFLLPPNAKATRPELWKTKGNASLYVRPQVGTLEWNTDRPIYDLRAGRKLTREEAATVDLTKDAFQWYALPPAEPTTPSVRVGKRADGFYEAHVTVADENMRGVPVQLRLSSGQDSVELFGASGFPIPLPLSENDPAAKYILRATELLSGLGSETQIATQQRSATLSDAISANQSTALRKFSQRKEIPLIIALTPEQEKKPEVVKLAQALAMHYRDARGRSATVGLAAPGGVVESLQPLRSPHRFPQWKTMAADLVLLGLPSQNVLMLDQLRAEIWPIGFRVPQAGTATIIYTRSPFVGERDVVNIVASDLKGLSAGASALMKP